MYRTINQPMKYDLAGQTALRTLAILRSVCIWPCCALGIFWMTAAALGQPATEVQDSTQQLQNAPPPSTQRTGYIVKVPLPLIGDRDAEVIQQIRRIAQVSADADVQRPVVVLQFESTGLPQQVAGNPAQDIRGSQFERCLSLARFLTDREAAALRPVAYLPQSVVGHAVLPVLACQEIFARPGVQLGNASADSAVEPTILAAYRDIVARGRTNIPWAVVEAMLLPNIELRRISVTDSPGTQVVSLADANRLQDEGKVSEFHETIWNGAGPVLLSAEQMRSWLWIAPTVQSLADLTSNLGVDGSLRSIQQLPREWRARSIKIDSSLDQQRVNQLLRSIRSSVDQSDTNLLVFQVQSASCDLQQAERLASAIADLRDKVYTVGLIKNSLTGPISLVPVACNEAILIGQSTVGPDNSPSGPPELSDVQLRALDDLASRIQRPFPLLTVLADRTAVVSTYVHQGSGLTSIFSQAQIQNHVDRQAWVPKQRVAGGTAIQPEVAMEYGLINSVEETSQLALSRLGLSELPEPMRSSWIDATITLITAQPWIARLLLMIGMMALMVELGSPGISLGGLVAGLCFLGYFWIEALNGNVEMLEILLFFGGIFVLAIELFVLPGFGIFGVTGLMMIFVSLVLAAQTFVWPTSSAELSTVSSNLFWIALIGLGGMIGLVFLHQKLEQLPMFRWLSLQPGGTESIEEVQQREVLTHYEHLAGQLGLTTTRLNPSGKAQFGDDLVSVVGCDGMIEAGSQVRVVEVRGNLIIVEEYQ
jgi:hypothetical protein